MTLQTFRAPTMAEALNQVKSTMGIEAIILHTRTFQTRYCFGLRRREIVEVTAGKGLNVMARNRPKAKAAPQQQAMPAPRPQPVMASVAETGKQILQTPAAGNAAILGLSQEMASLKAAVQGLVEQQRHNKAPEVPEQLFNYYSQLIQNQVATELAIEIIKTLQRQVRPEYFNQPDFMRQRISEQIEKLLPTTGPIVKTKATGPHIVALIGPTGVGKTTTIAKIAADLKLRQKRRVGLITIDTYRIAAVDQLKKFADILSLRVQAVSSPDDLKQAIAGMSDLDFILIDTAGRSPNDTLKLHELKSFLHTAGPDEVHLVLSTTASQECVELAIERFTDVRVDKIIFTKLDEAAHVGVVLNVVTKVNKSLSYITTGQDVPEDIEVGRGRRLAQMILGME
ncbi:MAG TPA: flagellar biosynthesis protein FlhF [Tepidisphaeraceae bacterium]